MNVSAAQEIFKDSDLAGKIGLVMAGNCLSEEIKRLTEENDKLSNRGISLIQELNMLKREISELNIKLK